MGGYGTMVNTNINKYSYSIEEISLWKSSRGVYGTMHVNRNLVGYLYINEKCHPCERNN
jgi:hypothetical protein